MAIAATANAPNHAKRVALGNVTGESSQIVLGPLGAAHSRDFGNGGKSLKSQQTLESCHSPRAAPRGVIYSIRRSTAIDEEHYQMSRNDQILYILQGLVGRSQDVEGAMLVTLDGLPLASALPQGADEDRVAAMAAAALSMGARTTAELRRGSLEQVLVKGDSGYVVIISAGKDTVLAAISNGEAKLGMILYEMKLAARDLARELG
jgi:hypothetical protein